MFDSLCKIPRRISVFRVSPGHCHFSILIRGPGRRADVTTQRTNTITTVGNSCFSVGTKGSIYCLHGSKIIVSAASAKILTAISGKTMLVGGNELRLVP